MTSTIDAVKAGDLGVLLAEQHRRYCSVLPGHYGYYGRPHNYPTLSGFRQQIRRIWFRRLRRRSQWSQRMGWDEFEALTARFPPATTSGHASVDATSSMMRVTFGKSQVLESRKPGSVRADADRLSYSTTNCFQLPSLATEEGLPLVIADYMNKETYLVHSVVLMHEKAEVCFADC